MTRERALALATEAWEHLCRDFPSAGCHISPGFAVRVLAKAIEAAVAEERQRCVLKVADVAEAAAEEMTAAHRLWRLAKDLAAPEGT